LVKFSTLARYRRENPDFARFVSAAMIDRYYGGAAPQPADTFHYDWNPADMHAIPAMLPDNFPG
jgi:hypothetical protein